MMKIAVSSYSFSQAQRDERHMNLFDMIKKAKELQIQILLKKDMIMELKYQKRNYQIKIKN